MTADRYPKIQVWRRLPEEEDDPEPKLSRSAEWLGWRLGQGYGSAVTGGPAAVDKLGAVCRTGGGRGGVPPGGCALPCPRVRPRLSYTDSNRVFPRASTADLTLLTSRKNFYILEPEV